MLSCKYCQNAIDETRAEKKDERIKGDRKKGQADIVKPMYKCPSCQRFNDPTDCGCSV